jgi:hypothetical protein
VTESKQEVKKSNSECLYSENTADRDDV